MAKIRILNDNIINKIAAGEVIERPASIIKELLDNSIDANSKNISIEIKSAGKRYIRIIDDGSGMDDEDIFFCIERHATSKIKNIDDLFNIKTHGFRGEAISSIAAISQMMIKSKTKSMIEANELFIQGGKLISSKKAALSQGTDITVSNIFFNTPVRKKFLKTNATELTHILNKTLHTKLAYPELNIKLISEGKTIFTGLPYKNKLETILSIYGFNLKNDLIQINEKPEEGIEIEAYLGKPDIARKYKDWQYIFVNNRCIKNNTINYSVYNSFQTLLPKGYHPVYFVFLKVNPSIVDVNVHPTKNEVRFTNYKYLQSLLENVFKKYLHSENLAPQVKIKIPTIKMPEKKEEINLELKSKPIKPIQQTLDFDNKPDSKLKSNINLTEVKQEKAVATLKNEPDLTNNINYKILGQVNNLYIIVETKKKMMIIDQHAAHERILYNKIMKLFNNEKLPAQRLLFPVSIELSPQEKNQLKDWMSVLDDLGFEIEDFGGNTILIRTVPLLLGKRTDDKRLFLDIIDDILVSEKINSIEQKIHKFVSVMACRSAVKAGNKLFPNEMKKIVEEVLINPEVKTCPHGRPVVIELTFNELEKQFLRKK